MACGLALGLRFSVAARVKRPAPSPPTASVTRSQASIPVPAETVHAIIAEDLEALAPHLDAWDALAVTHGRPFCAPAWMLAWWSQARTGDARLRVVLVSDEHGL